MTRKNKLIALVVIISLAIIVGIIHRFCECGLNYENCYWRDWTGLGAFTDPKGNYTRSKTIWDILSLVIVPLALALTVWLLNRAQEKNKQQIESDRQRQIALENYFDKMSELLLKENLRDINANPSEARKIARTRTLGLMPALDSGRKAQALQFVYEADLVNRNNPILNLLGIDMSKSNLSNALLHDVKINGADFTDANLEGASLNNADFCGSLFIGSNFKDANLMEVNFDQAVFTDAIFSNANLRGARITAAIFDGADLSSVQFFTQEMLDTVGSCRNARLPPGLNWRY